MLQAQWRALPQLIRFMATQFADGVALGWACGLALIRLDVGSIGSLLERSGSAVLRPGRAVVRNARDERGVDDPRR